MNTVLMMVLQLGMIFGLKVIENMLDATKIILIQKNRYVFSGLALFVAVLINYYVMRIIVASEGSAVMVTAAAAAGIGYMVAGKVSDRFLHGTYIEIIRCDDVEAIKEIHRFLTKKSIKHDVLDSYNKDLDVKTRVIYASPRTKAEQRMIKEFIEQSTTKFNHVIIE